MRNVIGGIVLLAAALWIAGPASAQNPPAPTDPVVDPSAPMTIAQVRRGEEVYAGKCANCHGPKLEGKTSTPLTGPVFAGKWSEQTAKDLFARVRTMPYGAANSLNEGQYLDLTAFILAGGKSARMGADSRPHRRDSGARAGGVCRRGRTSRATARQRPRLGDSAARGRSHPLSGGK